MKYLFSLLLLLFILTPDSKGQTLVSAQNDIYKAYTGGDIPLWEAAAGDLQALYKRRSDPEVLYNLVLSWYGLSGYYAGTGDKARARELIDLAEPHIETLIGNPSYQSRGLAFQGAFLGFRVSLSPLRAMVLGPRSMNAIDKAMEVDPGNPTAHLEKGNALFYAPSIFGGSKIRAIEHYSTAIDLLEKQRYAGNRWLYLSTLVSLATAYESTDNIPMAVKTLEKALAAEPGFIWVRDELLPQTRKKL